MPGKYTEELGDAWVTAFEELGAISFACDAVGIHYTTWRDWMEKGERGVPGYTEFYFKARLARSKAAGALINLTRRDKGGPQFLLERLFPAEFGAPAKSARDAMQQLLELVLPRLSLSARSEVLDALASLERERTGSSEQRVAGTAEAGAEPIDAAGELIGEPRRLEPGTE